MLSVLQSSVHSTYYYGEKPFIWIENWPSLLRAEYNNVSIVRFDCCCFSALAPSLSSFFLLSFFHSWFDCFVREIFSLPALSSSVDSTRAIQESSLSFQSERAREKRKGERSVLYSSAAVTLFIFSTSLFLSIQFFFSSSLFLVSNPQSKSFI